MEQTVSITPRASDQIARGSLWIFSNELVGKPPPFAPGTWCWFALKDQVVATGYFNPHSLISGRVLNAGREKNIPQALEARLKRAFERRRLMVQDALAPSAIGSARLVFSEADFLPGLVIDFYQDQESRVLVLQSNTAGMDAVLEPITDLAIRLFRSVFRAELTGLLIRADSGIRRLEQVEDFKRVVFGSEESLANGSLEQDGVRYAADFLSGQKTGFFLDQRSNRAFLAQYVKRRAGARVLDLCCYSGGWGLRALKAGAAHVTFVDESAAALALVRRGLSLNNFSETKAAFHERELFEFLTSDTGLYDAVVADPPAFGKSKKNLPQAMRAYEKLNRLAWRRLKPGGLLLTCSCSFHLAESDFLGLLKTAVAAEKGRACLVYRGGQASDHPILLSMPETQYLKCVGLEKI